MLKKFAVALVALFVLSGCSSCSTGGGSDTSTSSSQYIAEFERVVGDRVFFALNSSDLSSEAKSTLMRQAKWLKEHDSFNITIEGHCDERGTREYNIALGERRADAAKKFLVQQGIDSSRIDTVSFGKERPAVIGSNEDAWKQNRRSVTSIR